MQNCYILLISLQIGNRLILYTYIYDAIWLHKRLMLCIVFAWKGGQCITRYPHITEYSVPFMCVNRKCAKLTAVVSIYLTGVLYNAPLSNAAFPTADYDFTQLYTVRQLVLLKIDI